MNKLKEKPASSIDAFDLLLPIENRRRWNGKTYTRKNKLSKIAILPFQNEDTKHMIVHWLSNTQNIFDRKTQSQEIYDFSEDNNSFNLPSVSQKNINPKQTKTDYINLRTRKIRRPHSLDLKRFKTPIKTTTKKASVSFNSISCNYNIEEFDTGPKIGADMQNPSIPIQKNVIQQLEDEFLDSIETDVDITKYTKINQCDSNVASSGWDRMKEMKKSVCKRDKRVKKLKTLVKINSTLKTNDSVRENGVNHVDAVIKKSARIKKKNSRYFEPPIKDETVKKIYTKTSVNNQNEADVEFIDLTIGHKKEPKINTKNKKITNNCEAINKDIFNPGDILSKKTTKSANSEETEEIFLLATPRVANIQSSNENLTPQQFGNENLVDGIFMLPNNNNCETEIKIPLEIEKLQKLIENSTDFELEHKSILLSKFHDILQLLQTNFVFNNKTSIGNQTDQILMHNVSTQSNNKLKNIEVQTVSIKNTAISTQTCGVLRLEKCQQTSCMEAKLDVAVQVHENDFPVPPQQEIINSIVGKYVNSQNVTKNNTCHSEFINEQPVEDFDECIFENTSPENQLETNLNSSKSTEQLMIDDNLNIAVLLTDSEISFTKQADVTPNCTKIDSVDIVSQTQSNKILKNSQPRKKTVPPILESIGIVSQTQLNRSPIKLFKAKLLSEQSFKNALSPAKNSSHAQEYINDSFDNLTYDTADILAGAQTNFRNKSFKTQSEVSNIEISVEKVQRKLDFDKNIVQRVKRIRFPDEPDSNEDERTPNKRLKNNFVREDLSIQFQTEADFESDENLLVDSIPGVYNMDLGEDFNLKECFGNTAQNNINNNKTCTSNFNTQLEFTKNDATVLFKSPKRPKHSILSEIICPNHSEKSPIKINILDNFLVQSAKLQVEIDTDSNDVIYSDDSFEEYTKLQTNTPVKDKSLNLSKLPSLGDTPDMFNLPLERDDIVLSPPKQFANIQPELDNTTPHNLTNTSTQTDLTVHLSNYDVLSLSPIKTADQLHNPPQNNVCPLVITKRDRPKAKPLNIWTQSTPKVKQSSIVSFIKRTQNRTCFNKSSSSLFQETEELVQKNVVDSSFGMSIPCIACSRLNKEDVIAVTSLVRKKLITFKICFDETVTHMIVSAHKNNYVKDHTMKYISAVAAGIWIVNADWVKECVRMNEIVNEELYEVLDVSGFSGPKNSRLFRTNQPLLANFRILASPPFRASERSIIEDVIKNLGGTVISTATEFLNKCQTTDLIITEASSTQSFLVDDDWLNVYHVATVDIEWLSRSVGQYKVLSLLPFLLCDADEVQDLNIYPEKLLASIPGFTFSTQKESE